MISTCCLALAAMALTTPPRADFTVIAGDYFLRLPASVPAGWRTVRFRNTGHEFHHAAFLRVPDSASAERAVRELATWSEDWDHPVAGTSSVGGVEASLIIAVSGERPGDNTYVTLDLRPGLYLVLCMIPTRGGLHVGRGMRALLRVTAPGSGAAASRAPPPPDAKLEAGDYSFRLTPARLAPGWRVIEVSSRGPAEHVAEFARLAPERRLADVLAQQPGAADPEAAVIGGSTRLARGTRVYVWLYLTRGTYVVQCPLHTPAHRSHLALGMIAELDVRPDP